MKIPFFGPRKVISKIAVTTILCWPAFSNAMLYFNAKIYGPVTNIYAIDEIGNVTEITKNTRWKDIEHDVSSIGDVVFSSNRKKDTRIDLHKSFDIYDLYIFDKNTSEITKLTSTREREYSPKFNPSGNLLAYLKILNTKNTELRLIDLKEKKDRLLTASENIFDFSWSPEGDEIVFSEVTKKQTSLKIINVKTTTISTLIKSPLEKNKNAIYLTAPSWSPDGKLIAYVTHPTYREGEKALFVVDLKTKKIVRLSKEKQQVQSPIHWSKDSNRIIYSSLVNYQFYYDEKIMDKVYKGSMQVFISDIKGKTSQLTTGDYFHGKPIFSPDESKVAFLFSEKLGGALSYSLKILDIERKESKELHKSVQRESKLVWK